MIRIGQILFTKDGRHTGNAIVLDWKSITGLGRVYRCRTDFGNEISMTIREIDNQFYTSKNGEVRQCHPAEHWADQLIKLGELKL